MKKFLLYLQVAIFIASSMLTFNSCSKDDDLKDPSVNPSILTGTKWTDKNWDLTYGDDWATMTNEIINIYFYSDTEGVLYYGRKDLDTDFGSSNYWIASHFTYGFEGDVVSLTYINNPLKFTSILVLKGKGITMNGVPLTKGQIDSSDKSWINTMQGKTGDCKWYHDLKGSIYITGDGDMDNYTSFNNTPWGRNKNLTTYVEIQPGVTSVGDYAFATMNLAEVKIPYMSKLKRIGKFAFHNSTISEINLPNEITEIGTEAFSKCTYLTKVMLPENVEDIGDGAFADCKSAGLARTKRIRRIGDMAFTGCEVTSWTDSEVLEEIGNLALTHCSFKTLVLPNSLKSIGNGAFGGKISEIRIGTHPLSIIGTPFFPSSSGKLYVNQNNPMSLSYDIVNSYEVKNWTLYVPSGSKSAYSNSNYWKNFKSIIEDQTLDGDGTTVVGGNDGNSNNDNDNGVYTGVIQGHEYVDLGLSVKWATCNIGASSPEEDGDYVYWSKFSSLYWLISDYNEGDKINLSGDANWDAAYINWGNKWQMPTQAQFQELIDNCTFSLVKVNNINVIKATSNINKQYIIFPLCGEMKGLYDYGDTEFEPNLKGSAVRLWTGNGMCGDYIYVYAYIFSVGSNLKEISCSVRLSLYDNIIYSTMYKLPIRPVTK